MTSWVTDIAQYLDENREIDPSPGPARDLSCYFSLTIEAATSARSIDDLDTRIR